MKKANKNRPSPASLVKEVRALLGKKLLEKVYKYTELLVDSDYRLTGNRMFILTAIICIRRANDVQNKIVDLDVFICVDMDNQEGTIISGCPSMFFDTTHTAKKIVQNILKHKIYL